MQSLESTSDTPDRELVSLALQNDQDAFSELVRRHYRRCVGVATILLHNRWDAEDQVQIAFSKAHTRLYQYQGQGELATWLMRIVKNQCLVLMRERRRARFVHLDGFLSDTTEVTSVDVPWDGPDPEGELALDQLKQILRVEIEHVPPMMRNIIRLHHIQGLSMAEIAEALQISIPAAKSRLMRARAELRSRLKCRCASIGPLSPLSISAAPFDRVAYRQGTQTALVPASG